MKAQPNRIRKAQNLIMKKKMRITILSTNQNSLLPSFLCISLKPFSLSLSLWKPVVRWMAKNNKYTAINFNHIYEKTITSNTTNHPSKNPSLSSSSSYSSASYSAVSAPNKHGRILVLTRPTPKPVTHPAPSPPPTQPNPPIQHLPDRPRSEPGPDSISLRPLGRTGLGPSLSSPPPVLNHDKDKDLFSPQQSPKPDKFVPPHLRPGFVPREERLGPEPGRVRDNGRPKSGGYDRMRRGSGSDMGRSSRPNSSG